METSNIIYKITEDTISRYDKKYNFMSSFNRKTGCYIRTNVLKDGVETDEEPFMASYPHLIDVGIMGHCIHGTSGLCVKAGIECYQNGLSKKENNMSLENFERICKESSGLIDQIALGGRGDPDCHEEFENILKICEKYYIVPNYTTSGLLMNKEKAELSKKYCGAVAVSWYRSEYTLKAINLLLETKVKTNIHFVVDNNSIDEAIDLLRNNKFPLGINAVIFLLFKPVGQGTNKNMLKKDDVRIKTFFEEVEKLHPFKIGFDSCFVPGIINNMKRVDYNSIDTCEGSRFSMYISPNMVALPCSFDQDYKYAYDIKNNTIANAWESKEFNNFRNILKNSCYSCKRKNYCYGGCPLIKEIVLCSDIKI